MLTWPISASSRPFPDFTTINFVIETAALYGRARLCNSRRNMQQS
jgi:hypothetical protein